MFFPPLLDSDGYWGHSFTITMPSVAAGPQGSFSGLPCSPDPESRRQRHGQHHPRHLSVADGCGTKNDSSFGLFCSAFWRATLPHPHHHHHHHPPPPPPPPPQSSIHRNWRHKLHDLPHGEVDSDWPPPSKAGCLRTPLPPLEGCGPQHGCSAGRRGGGWKTTENMTEDVPKNGDVHRYSTTNTIKHIAWDRGCMSINWWRRELKRFTNKDI